MTEPQLAQAVADIPRWEFQGDRLTRSFEFATFTEAFGFMTRVALVSENLFHHPEWSNVYNRVEVRITDHDAGGISTNDREWIERVDGLAG